MLLVESNVVIGIVTKENIIHLCGIHSLKFLSKNTWDYFLSPIRHHRQRRHDLIGFSSEMSLLWLIIVYLCRFVDSVFMTDKM